MWWTDWRTDGRWHIMRKAYNICLRAICHRPSVCLSVRLSITRVTSVYTCMLSPLCARYISRHWNQAPKNKDKCYKASILSSKPGLNFWSQCDFIKPNLQLCRKPNSFQQRSTAGYYAQCECRLIIRIRLDNLMSGTIASWHRYTLMEVVCKNRGNP